MESTERQVTLDADVEQSWDLLTRPEDLADWLGAEVEVMAPGAGGVVVDVDGTRRLMRVDEVDEGRRLSWWWWPNDGGDSDGPASYVEITLTPVETGTRIVVVELPMVAAPATSASCGSSTRTGWSHRLLHLELLALHLLTVRG